MLVNKLSDIQVGMECIFKTKLSVFGYKENTEIEMSGIIVGIYNNTIDILSNKYIHRIDKNNVVILP